MNMPFCEPALHRFACNQDGGIAPFFALLLLPIMLLAAVAIKDASTQSTMPGFGPSPQDRPAVFTTSRAADAADAAAWPSRSNVTGSDPAKGETDGKVEVGMMIDLTGSMGAERNGMSKIDGLKRAAQDFLNKLFPEGDDANVRVAIAPMADYVNAGPYAALVTGLPEIGSYAKADNLTQTRQGRFSGSYSGYYGRNPPQGSQFGATHTAAGGATYDNQFCTGANADETYFGYLVGTKVSRYHSGAVYASGRWYSKQRYWNSFTHSYQWHYDPRDGDWIIPARSPACGQAADQTGKLITCTTERTDVATRYTDDAPATGRFVGAYHQSASGPPDQRAYSADGLCYVAGRELPAILPLTSSKSALQSFFSKATVGGATPGHLGHAWVWYLLSPKWKDIWPSASRPAPYAEVGVRKVAILLTDGEYNMQYAAETARTQALELCAGMKSAGIEIHTIGFGFSSGSHAGDGTSEGNAKDVLERCASGETHVNFPYDGEALRRVLARIGDGIRARGATMSALGSEK